MSDAELLQQMKQGDLEAWRSLYARYLPALWRFISARVSDMHAAEDILSETMLGFYRAVDAMDSDCKIMGWLRSVAQNKVSDHFRKKGRRDRLINGVAETHSDAHYDVDRMAAEEARENIAGILDQLTDHERVALEWKYIDGVAVKTIAERLSLTEKAAESLLYRGRRAFRKWFLAKGASDEVPNIANNIREHSDRTLKP